MLSREQHQVIYDALIVLVQKEIPGFKIAYKSESKLQFLIGTLLWPISPTYMTDFVSTVYPVVYFPDPLSTRASPEESWKILAHEYVHLWDQKRARLSFPLSYLFPQILALLSLGAFAAFAWLPALFCLLALLALAPWPSPGRAKAESRGYAMSMAVHYWTAESTLGPYKSWITDMFTGWAYYRMNPNRDEVLRTLNSWEEGLKSGAVLTSPEGQPFRDVHNLLQQLGVLRSV